MGSGVTTKGVATKTVSVPAIPDQRQMAIRGRTPDMPAPLVVDGEVVRSRYRLPIFRTRVLPMFVNFYWHRPDTMLQALTPAFVVALPIAATAIVLWWLVPAEAMALSAVLLLVSAVHTARPDRSVAATARRLVSLLGLVLLVAPGRAAVHCCCRLVRLR